MFTIITVKHELDLFDKLLLPILNYAYETWGFHCVTTVWKVHLNTSKHLLGVWSTTQSGFVLQISRLHAILK